MFSMTTDLSMLLGTRSKFEFPFRVHDMLEDVEREGKNSVVSWSPCGTSFRIHKPKDFAGDILPRYFFHQTKYRSFLRQLNIYGFNWIKEKDLPGGGTFYHKFFVRGDSELCSKMSRVKNKGTGKKALKVTNNSQDETTPTVSMNLAKTNDAKRSRCSSQGDISQEIEACASLPVCNTKIDWEENKRSKSDSSLARDDLEDGDEIFFAGKKFFFTTAYIPRGIKAKLC